MKKNYFDCEMILRESGWPTVADIISRSEPMVIAATRASFARWQDFPDRHYLAYAVMWICRHKAKFVLSIDGADAWDANEFFRAKETPGKVAEALREMFKSPSGAGLIPEYEFKGFEIEWPLPNLLLLLDMGDGVDTATRLQHFVHTPARWRGLEFAPGQPAYPFSDCVWGTEYVAQDINPGPDAITETNPQPVQLVHWLVTDVTGGNQDTRRWLIDESANNGLPIFFNGNLDGFPDAEQLKSYPADWAPKIVKIPAGAKVEVTGGTLAEITGEEMGKATFVTANELSEYPPEHWRRIRLRIPGEQFWGLFEEGLRDQVAARLCEPITEEEFSRVTAAELGEMRKWFEPEQFRGMLRMIPIGQVWWKIEQMPEVESLEPIFGAIGALKPKG